MDYRVLHRMAADQRGLFTRKQAMQAGASSYQITARIKRGEWIVVLGGVLAVAGLPVSNYARAAAALLHMPGTALAGPTAASRYELISGGSEVFVAGGAYRRSPHGVTIVRGRLPAEDVVITGGWPMTGMARTVVDCLRLLPDDDARDVLDRALNRRLVTADQVAQKIGELKGKPGTLRLKELLKC